MSEFNFRCLHCGQNFACDDSYDGQIMPCPSCNKELHFKKPKTYYQCYECMHQYDPQKIGVSPGQQITCPQCNKTIFCQEMQKNPQEYLAEINFTTHYTFTTFNRKILIDDDSKNLVSIYSDYLLIIPYEKVINWDIIQEQEAVKTQTVGNLEGKRTATVTGAILGGPVGAMVGAAGQRDINLVSNTNLKYRYHLNIILNDIEHPSIKIADMSRSSIEDITARLHVIKNYNLHNISRGRSIIKITFEKPRNYFKEYQKAMMKDKYKNVDDDLKSCLAVILITIILSIIILFASCGGGCDSPNTLKTPHSTYDSTESEYQTTSSRSSSSNSDRERRKRIARWIRECDNREWRNPDGDIAIKKAAKHFGISESEAMEIALEGLKEGW